jgi:hypothetical protein
MEQGSKAVSDPAVDFNRTFKERERSRPYWVRGDYRLRERERHVKRVSGRLTHLDHLPSQLIDGTRGTERGDEGRTSHLRWKG